VDNSLGQAGPTEESRFRARVSRRQPIQSIARLRTPVHAQETGGIEGRLRSDPIDLTERLKARFRPTDECAPLAHRGHINAMPNDRHHRKSKPVDRTMGRWGDGEMGA